MRRAVRSDQAGTIDCEGDRQALQTDIVHQLVEGALQESGVDGDHRAQSASGKTGGEGHRVLLGDADIVVTIGKTLGEGAET